MIQVKWKAMLRSLLLSYILTGILLLVLSFALYKFHLKESQISMAVNAIYIITCLLGGILAGKAIRQRKFFWGLVLGLVYFGVLLLVSYLMNRGLNGNMNQVLTVMGMCAGSGTIGGMMA